MSSQFLSAPVSFCNLSRVVKILEKNFSKSFFPQFLSFETASLFILWKSGLAELVSTKENVSKFSILLLHFDFSDVANGSRSTVVHCIVLMSFYISLQ